LEKRASITIYQAFYGDVGKSHGCIKSTLDDAGLKSFLTAFTDRPSSVPAGTVLESYISGKAYGSYYVFTKTFPDNDAPRGGMVFTHALIIQMDDLAVINNIDFLFSHFISSIPEDKQDLSVMTLDNSHFLRKNNPEKFPTYIQQTVEKLIASKLPVVFCGKLTAFQYTISCIWLYYIMYLAWLAFYFAKNIFIYSRLFYI
jgi:hypothetical protein